MPVDTTKQDYWMDGKPFRDIIDEVAINTGSIDTTTMNFWMDGKPFDPFILAAAPPAVYTSNFWLNIT